MNESIGQTKIVTYILYKYSSKDHYMSIKSIVSASWKPVLAKLLKIFAEQNRILKF